MSVQIQVGDRVEWEHRPPRGKIAAKTLTGIVRDIKRTTHDHYAVVATDPDGRLCMPSFDKLVRVERVKPVNKK